MKVKDMSQGRLVSELAGTDQGKARGDFSSSVLACLPQPVLVLSPKGTVEYVNHALEKATGLSAVQLIGAGPPYPWCADDSAGVRGKELQKMVWEGPVTVVESVRKRDGRRFWVEATYVLLSRGRSARHVVSTWVDVTEREREMQRMRRDIDRLERVSEKLGRELDGARRYAEDILGTVREPLVVLGPDLKVVTANRSFYLTFRLTPRETEGRVIYGVGDHRWDSETLRQLLEETLPRNVTCKGMEMEHYFPVGGARTMLLSARRVTGEDDRTKLIILAIEDITELKRAAHAAREAQDRLVRHEKLAVLGQLAGGLGHELRNPLGAIKNAAYYLNMVLKDPEPEVGEMLEILQTETATSERIVASLLDFARPKRGAKRKVQVSDIVDEVLCRTVVPDNITVRRQFDVSAPQVWADRDQLVQVFGNLVLNAIQAMPGGGELTVALESRGEGVAVWVRDTGVGVTEENLSRLFEPLFTTKAKGIGLGLPITKALVEDHGGSIEVERVMGPGCSFAVWLPVRARGVR